jgi:hypothetical protein
MSPAARGCIKLESALADIAPRHAHDIGLKSEWTADARGLEPRRQRLADAIVQQGQGATGLSTQTAYMHCLITPRTSSESHFPFAPNALESLQLTEEGRKRLLAIKQREELKNHLVTKFEQKYGEKVCGVHV